MVLGYRRPDDVDDVDWNDEVEGCLRSLDEAVADNNVSRVYIGYHFRAATVEGDRVGRLLGRYVAEHALQPVRGTR